MNNINDYWEECLAQSFEEHGVKATNEQIQAIAKDVDNARDCIGMAFPVPENPWKRELAAAESALKREQSMRFCVICQGTGRVQYYTGPWAVNTQCDKCHGNGKHA